MGIDELPPEIIYAIAKNLDSKGAAAMSKVCKDWEAATKKLSDDKKRVEIMKVVMQKFLDDSRDALAGVKLMPVGPFNVPPTHPVRKQIKETSDLNQSNNLKITKLYNEMKKVVSKDVWDSNVGKQLVAAGAAMNAVRKEFADRNLI